MPAGQLRARAQAFRVCTGVSLLLPPNSPQNPAKQTKTNQKPLAHWLRSRRRLGFSLRNSELCPEITSSAEGQPGPDRALATLPPLRRPGPSSGKPSSTGRPRPPVTGGRLERLLGARGVRRLHAGPAAVVERLRNDEGASAHGGDGSGPDSAEQRGQRGQAGPGQHAAAGTRSGGDSAERRRARSCGRTGTSRAGPRVDAGPLGGLWVGGASVGRGGTRVKGSRGEAGAFRGGVWAFPGWSLGPPPRSGLAELWDGATPHAGCLRRVERQ